MKAVLLATLSLLPLAVGCGAPGWAAGTFGDADFQLSSDDPLAQAGGSQRDMVVVMAEVDGETLRTVSVALRHFKTIALGDEVAAGTGKPDDARPFVEVTTGELITEDRGDGVELISSRDPARAVSLGGRLTLDALEPRVTGSFVVDLDDGGKLEGSFIAKRTE